MNSYRSLLAVALLVGAAACDTARIAAPAGPVLDEVAAAPAPGAEVVQAATLDWLIANRGGTSFDAFCVSLGDDDADPSAAFLARYAGNQPPVVPLSDCTVAVAGTTYNLTGGPAQWFFVGDPVFHGRRAEVDAGFQVNGRLAEFYHCTLHPGPGGGYVVQRCDLTGAA
ncbi:MAG TPA: hypothetical protein VFQ39_07905 [Longimicrobium sp.]|nr:hypothetical protein [Longimicrobium sp.]